MPTDRTACFAPQPSPLTQQTYPNLTVLRYQFETGQVTCHEYPYYISKKGQFCFRGSPATFHGMKEGRFDQFTFYRRGFNRGQHPGAEMVVGIDRDKSLAHFYKCITRAKQRLSKEKK